MKIWQWLKGKKRSIGLTVTLTVGFAVTNGWISTELANWLLAVLTAWGVVAVADGARKPVES